ncbi:MAG: DUF2127 domain-containing protein [Candidatus Limnocylindrales bacterium]
MRGTSADGRDPRAMLVFVVALLVIQGIYAGLEILPDASTGGTLAMALGAGFIVYAAMIVAVAFGVWRGTSWAWILAVASTVVGLVLAVIQVADGAPIGSHLLGMIIDVGLFIYLQRPSIKVLFVR